MNILVLTDNDLDGAGSALLIKWLFAGKASTIDIAEVTELTLPNEIKAREQSLSKYDKIFVLDLDLSEENIRLVDRKGVVVIDHHIPHSKKVDLYKNAKTIIQEYSSCSKLILNKFKPSLTPQQEELIKYIDDYDSYTLQYKDSLKLNAIYLTYNRPKVEKFINSFENGFRDYTVYEKNSIKLFIQKFKEQLQNQVFQGNIKQYRVVSIISNYAVSEVANFIINKYDADIGIIVNVDTKTVSLRRSKESDVDISIIAKALCSGGGSPTAAGGKLTPEFANLTKTFTPC